MIEKKSYTKGGESKSFVVNSPEERGGRFGPSLNGMWATNVSTVPPKASFCPCKQARYFEVDFNAKNTLTKCGVCPLRVGPTGPKKISETHFRIFVIETNRT